MSLALEINNLKVRAPDGTPILAVPRLAVAAGECVGISGPSGAGKSTLIYALAGLGDRVEGQLSWNGRNLVVLSATDRTAFRREHIGMIFQDFMLFEELSATQNAALAGAFSPLARRRSITENAVRLLDRLGVDHGGRAVETFSGGERQRVAIARALAHEPAVILADEPTASLERRTADAVIADLVALARTEGRTLIVVSHDPHVHAQMDRVLTVVDGVLLDEASA